MRNLKELKETLYMNLDDFSGKRESFNLSDLERVHMITDTIKNIDKICLLEDGDNEYSQRYMRGNIRYDGSYDDGNSYANRGKHYVKGHYSRDDGRKEMVEHLEKMMYEADDDRQRDIIEQCVRKLKEI